MYTPDDADVQLLLADMRLDPEQAGAKDAADRLKLLQKALQKTQHLGKFLRKVSDSEASPAVDAELDPRSLKVLDTRSKLVAKKFDCDEMLSMQEKLACQLQSPEIHTAWFELRRTLYVVIDKLVSEGIKRLHLMDNAEPHRMGGVIDFVGARVTPDGKVPLLETRHRFYYTTQVTKEYAAVETRTNPRRMRESLVMDVEPEEIKLLAVLFDANASRLSPSYVSAQQSSWGTGTQLTPSFLLPIEPLTQEVTLSRQCHVCGKDGARACGGCRAVAYCGKTCQNEDWKEHKAACKAAQAAAAAASTSVVIDLQEAVLDAPCVTSLPTNASVKQMSQAGSSSNITNGQASAARAEDPGKRFIVKVQATLGGMAMPLYLYDQRRKVVAYVNSTQQPAFGSLMAVIRQKGFMGAKLFCWAALDTQKKLRVFTDPLPSQTQSW